MSAFVFKAQTGPHRSLEIQIPVSAETTIDSLGKLKELVTGEDPKKAKRKKRREKAITGGLTTAGVLVTSLILSALDN